MSKRAAAVMASQASNLRHALTHLRGDRHTPTYGLELVEKVAEALEHAAKEELEAGKRWWKDQEAQRISQIEAEMAEVQRKIASPRQEPWL